MVVATGVEGDVINKESHSLSVLFRILTGQEMLQARKSVHSQPYQDHAPLRLLGR